jgi:hypothetical protein
MMQAPRFRRVAPEPDSVAADRLDGSGEIAEFWYGHDSAENRKKVYRLAETKALPIAKVGGRLVACRRALVVRYRRLTDPPADAAE